MIAVEFRLKISSAYSIRVPYSYQCARTYPLPAPSTIKGLCANALWRTEGGNPKEILENVNKGSFGAASRSEYSIAISSCTVRVIPMNALMRQFAFTPHIDCMIVFKDESLANRIKEALKIAPIYLGDSESLVCAETGSVHSEIPTRQINEGEEVKINSLVKFEFIKGNTISEKGVILYMQDDSCSQDAVLNRYIAPLKQQGDSYSPIESFSFLTSKKCFLAEGTHLKGIFCEPCKEEPGMQTAKHSRKKKA